MMMKCDWLRMIFSQSNEKANVMRSELSLINRIAEEEKKYVNQIWCSDTMMMFDQSKSGGNQSDYDHVCERKQMRLHTQDPPSVIEK